MSSTFSDSEKVDLLFKHLLNKPRTISSRDFYQEPSVTSRSFVYQEDIVSYSIPSTAPSDLTSLGDTDTDDNGYLLKGSYAGKTSTSDTNIKYYHKIPLEMIAGTAGVAWQAQDATYSHPSGNADGITANSYGTSGSYGRVMQSSIPFNQATDGTYNTYLYKSTGVAIPFGASGGDWLIDARPGVLTFYGFDNITGVNSGNIVYASFFRYIGATGVTSNSSVVSSVVTSTSNDYTAQQIFTGGTDGATSDTLSAVMIDSGNVFSSSFTDGELMQALQWGGNYNGSWRVCVQRVSSSSSKFLIQARESGNWTTKSSFLSP
jgi:hypothetical protein